MTGCYRLLLVGQKNNINDRFKIITNNNCRVPIWWVSFTVDVSEPEPKPNRPNTMNLVEKRA